MMEKTGNIKVLIVDDDADVRKFACRVLQLEGYICLVAETSEKTFKLMKENEVNLVLLDLRLTDINGWAILKKLKSDAATAPIPVIVFTASFGEQQRADALEMGAADYLIKPLSANELKNAIARILSSNKATI